MEAKDEIITEEAQKLPENIAMEELEVTRRVDDSCEEAQAPVRPRVPSDLVRLSDYGQVRHLIINPCYRRPVPSYKLENATTSDPVIGVTHAVEDERKRKRTHPLTSGSCQ